MNKCAKRNCIIVILILVLVPILGSEDLKPIVLDPSYNHTKYAPKPTEEDIIR